MRIAVLSSHTPSLFWFRMDMMKEFINKGHEVVALGADSEEEWKNQFKEIGIEYKQLYVNRNGINPLNDIRTFIELYKFMKYEKPDKVFTYQAKTVVYGSIAARLNGINDVYSLIAGLGSIFRGKGIKNKIIKLIMKIEYSIACKCSAKVLFQNLDDKGVFIWNRLVKDEKTLIINGSGVNIEKFQPAPFPEKPAFLFIGRLIKDKGIVEYLEACKQIKMKYPEIRCILVGPFDSNPSALKYEELQPYIREGIIEYYGEQNDVRPYIAQCSTFVLPSYHEGTPKTVLEAMAMGRPIITTNAPGCRETVINGLNGYLVNVKDIMGLVNKMDFLVSNPHISRELGKESHNTVIEKYDVKLVNQAIMKAMGLI